jgi:hypothetical protein
MQPKAGGKFLLRLNTGERPIANKYREGKMKRTLKRELKVREIVKRETLETSLAGGIPTGFNAWYMLLPAGQHRFELGYKACGRYRLGRL